MHTVGLSYVEALERAPCAGHPQRIRQTPWFIHYIDEIEDVLMQKYDRLVDLDLATMRLAMKWLGLKTEVQVSPTYVEEPASFEGVLIEDHRTDFQPKRPLPKSIPEIGPYAQVFADRHGFAGRLSIIDLVMNTGPDAAGIISSLSEFLNEKGRRSGALFIPALKVDQSTLKTEASMPWFTLILVAVKVMSMPAFCFTVCGKRMPPSAL